MGWYFASSRHDERVDIHEASATSDHDVLHVGQRLELGAALEEGRIFPDAGIFEEPAVAQGVGWSGCQSSFSSLLDTGKTYGHGRRWL